MLLSLESKDEGTTEFKYGKDQLAVDKAVLIAAGKLKGVLDDSTRKKVTISQQAVKSMAEHGKTVYGVTTSFGILANTKISEEDNATLQY